MTNLRIAWCALFLILAARGDGNGELRPRPRLDWAAVEAMLKDADMTDEVRLAKLASLLAERVAITLSGEYARSGAGREYARLAGMMANESISIKNTRSLEKLYESMVKEKARHAVCIGLALAWARGDGTPAEPALAVLAEWTEDADPAMAGMALYVLMPAVPLEATPFLLKLVHHPFYSGEGITPHRPPEPRVYPVRRAAVECLRKLGVVVDTDVELREVCINRPSLVNRLRAWVMDADEAVWRKGVRLLRLVSGEDVKALREQLRAEKDLPEAKRTALHEG